MLFLLRTTPYLKAAHKPNSLDILFFREVSREDRTATEAAVVVQDFIFTPWRVRELLCFETIRALVKQKANKKNNVSMACPFYWGLLSVKPVFGADYCR
jgi:hypothetical protein